MEAYKQLREMLSMSYNMQNGGDALSVSSNPSTEK